MGPPRLAPAKMVEVATDSKSEIPDLLPAHPAGRILRNRPARPLACAPHPAFDILSAFQTPTFLARIPRGRVLGPTVAVITAADRVLADVSLDWGHPGLDHYAYRRLKLPRCREFRGNALVLACTGSDTYFHWMTDALPRLAIAAKAKGVTWNPDWWVVSDMDKSFVRESLQLMGIPLSRVISLSRQPHVCFDQLWVPSLPCESSSGDPPPWVVDFLRSTFLPRTEVAGMEWASRLWIDRSENTSRVYPLPPEQRQLLKKLGIRVVRPETMSFRDQVCLFSRAAVCIGPHGAGFTNILFSHRPILLEIFPPDRVNACYYSLSQCVDAQYHYHVEAGTSLLSSTAREIHETLLTWIRS